MGVKEEGDDGMVTAVMKWEVGNEVGIRRGGG